MDAESFNRSISEMDSSAAATNGTFADQHYIQQVQPLRASSDLDSDSVSQSISIFDTQYGRNIQQNVEMDEGNALYCEPTRMLNPCIFQTPTEPLSAPLITHLSPVRSVSVVPPAYQEEAGQIYKPNSLAATSGTFADQLNIQLPSLSPPWIPVKQNVERNTKMDEGIALIGDTITLDADGSPIQDFRRYPYFLQEMHSSAATNGTFAVRPSRRSYSGLISKRKHDARFSGSGLQWNVERNETKIDEGIALTGDARVHADGSPIQDFRSHPYFQEMHSSAATNGTFADRPSCRSYSGPNSKCKHDARFSGSGLQWNVERNETKIDEGSALTGDARVHADGCPIQDFRNHPYFQEMHSSAATNGTFADRPSRRSYSEPISKPKHDARFSGSVQWNVERNETKIDEGNALTCDVRVHADGSPIQDFRSHSYFQQIYSVAATIGTFADRPSCRSYSGPISKHKRYACFSGSETEMNIQLLSFKLCGNWMEFGELFGFQMEELREIRRYFPGATNACLEMLKRWRDWKKDTDGFRATIDALKSYDGKAIPAEILARGPDAWNTFKAAREEGEKDFHLFRLNVIGQENAGKTCLIDSILGDKFNENHDITDGIATTRSCMYDETDPTKWQQDQVCLEGEMKEKYENALAEKIVEDLQPKQNHNVISAPENEISVLRIGTKHKEYPSKSEKEFAKLSAVFPRRQHLRVKRKVERIETKLDENVAKKVKNALKGDTISLNTGGNSIRIWDFGGQPIYHSILRFFLTPEGIFIIVFKLTDDLNAFTVIEDSNGKTRKYYMTNLQHLLYWIRSSYTYSSRSIRDHVLQLDLPACIIAGTHRNSLGDTEEEREKRVKQQFDLIRNAIKGKVYESHVYPTYFDVENQLSSSDKNIGKMKEVIVKIKNRMKGTIPIKWFEFLIRIQELSAENLTLPLEEVKSKARECGIKDEKTIDLAIAYFSDVGEIMHHPMDEALCDTVVLQPMELVDYVRTVFTVVKPELRDATLQNEWRELEKGVLRKSLLKHLWRNFPVFSDDKDEKMLNFFIALMKKFGLICQRKTPAINGTDNSIFYAFSHIQPDPEKRVIMDDQGPDKVSIFHDFCGFLPDYLYQETVTRFIEEFLVENANPELAYEYVELDVDAHHRVSLAVATIKHRRMFKTTILRRQLSGASNVTEPEPETCKKVLTFLQSVFDALCQTRERMQYKTCIPCGCSNNFQHMQIIEDFNKDAIPCGSDLWSIKRYCHLFGDSNEAIISMSQPDQRPLKDIELLSICNALDKDWKELALHLELTRPEIEHIECDNNHVKDAMMAMLVKWRDRQPLDINQMQVMYGTLKRAGYVCIADELMGKNYSVVLHDNDLLSVREGLGTNWARFAVCLGFDWRQTQLLKAEHRNSDLNACMDMLTQWKKRQSCEINQVDAMCGLLQQQGFAALADQLRCVVHSEGFLDDNGFALISDNICGDWDKVAVKLGIGWHSIKAIRNECCGREFRESMDMLTTWRTRQSSDINQLDVMCEILNGMGRSDIVEQLREKYA